MHSCQIRLHESRQSLKALQPARMHEQSLTRGAPECKIHGLVNFAGVPNGAGHVVEYPLGVVAHNVCAEQQACMYLSGSN